MAHFCSKAGEEWLATIGKWLEDVPLPQLMTPAEEAQLYAASQASEAAPARAKRTVLRKGCQDPRVIIKGSETDKAITALFEPLQKLPVKMHARAAHLAIQFPHIWNAEDRPLTATPLMKFSIDIKPGTQPVRCNRRPLSPAKLARLEEHLAYLEDMGVIKEWSRWTLPLVIVLKANGDDRICTDLLRVNAVTEAPKYPQPRIDQADLSAIPPGSGGCTWTSAAFLPTRPKLTLN